MAATYTINYDVAGWMLNITITPDPDPNKKAIDHPKQGNVVIFNFPQGANFKKMDIGVRSGGAQARDLFDVDSPIDINDANGTPIRYTIGVKATNSVFTFAPPVTTIPPDNGTIGVGG